jgi:hypothetical protein
MAIDKMKRPMAARFQKKNGITADDDPFHCKIDF